MLPQPDSVHIRTTVLPGHRIEVSDPALRDGDEVELRIATVRIAPRKGLIDVCREFPQGPHSAPTWEGIENNLRAERDAWDD